MIKGYLCFDMDGTIADLYNVLEWEPKMRSKDPSPFKEAKPLVNMRQLRAHLNRLRESGWIVSIITWYPPEAARDQEFKKQVRQIKKEWLECQGMPIDHYHCIKYGTPKKFAFRNTPKNAILFDDNQKVRDSWAPFGIAVDPTKCDILDFLASLE